MVPTLLTLILAAAPASAPELFLPGLVSTGDDDAHVSFAPDGTLYFLRDSPDFAHWTVLQTRQEHGKWKEPEVAPFSGQWDDGDVMVTRSGQDLFFISNRPTDGSKAARPDTEIWHLRRTANGWGPPEHVAELSSPGDEWFPTMTDDGTLYFGSERPGGLGQSDLWRARWVNGRFTAPENLGPVINSAGQEIEPMISPDGSFLIFSAKGRSDSKGSYDLYVSYQCAQGWTTPVPLGAGVNSSGWEFGPRFSPDGRWLYFTSNRSGFDTRPETPRRYADLMRALHSPGNGLRDVYRVPMAALGLESPCPPSKRGPAPRR